MEIDDSPVQFKCMIQDIIGREIYSKNDEGNEFSDRTVFYCITIPGQNEWINGDSENQFMTPNGSQQATCLTHQRLSFNLVSSSFPIPSKNNRSCLVMIYNDQIADQLKVNDIIFVEGKLEPIDPSDDLPSTEVRQPIQNQNGDNPAVNDQGVVIDPMAAMGGFEPTINFPSRLVPRVHASNVVKLRHINPLVPVHSKDEKVDKTNAQLVRARLSTILTQLFGGDSLAAEYIILSLISGVHRRKDVTTLGQLTIGITGITTEMDFLVKKIYDIIKRITTHSHYLEMSISNLNNLTFTPRKDHENNKLLSGTMQLPSGSYVLINETALSEGTLNSHGTQNIATLSEIIKWQRHSYDFKFHRVDIDTDIQILVMSEGKSLLPVECSIKLANTNPETIEQMRQACASVDDFITEDLLNKLRCYLTSSKEVSDYLIPENVQKSIEKNFVEWRRNDHGSKTFSSEDLSFYLTLARYLSLSRGESSLTQGIWDEVCEMERQRQTRLSK